MSTQTTVLRGTASRTGRGALGLVAMVIIVGVTVVSCSSTEPADDALPATTQQQCVQAVFNALSGMITQPSQDRPFDQFVDQYGTSSPAYAAYQHSFGQFYGVAVRQGVAVAETSVRPGVTKDCAASS
jgi:hypothetical protein